MDIKGKKQLILGFIFILAIVIFGYIRTLLNIENYRVYYMKTANIKITRHIITMLFSLALFLFRNKISNFMAMKYKKYSVEYYNFFFILYGIGLFMIGFVNILFDLFVLRR